MRVLLSPSRESSIPVFPQAYIQPHIPRSDHCSTLHQVWVFYFLIKAGGKNIYIFVHKGSWLNYISLWETVIRWGLSQNRSSTDRAQRPHCLSSVKHKACLTAEQTSAHVTSSLSRSAPPDIQQRNNFWKAFSRYTANVTWQEISSP